VNVAVQGRGGVTEHRTRVVRERSPLIVLATAPAPAPPRAPDSCFPTPTLTPSPLCPFVELDVSGNEPIDGPTPLAAVRHSDVRFCGTFRDDRLQRLFDRQISLALRFVFWF
jgi:hypothetical protein